MSEKIDRRQFLNTGMLAGAAAAGLTGIQPKITTASEKGSDVYKKRQSQNKHDCFADAGI